MSGKNQSRNKLRKVRHRRVRGKIKGTSVRPRLNVYRSLKFIYAQVIDDDNTKVLFEVDSRKVKGKDRMKIAQEVGELTAKKCIKKKINSVVFDKGGYKYHGRIKSLAEGARKAGLKF